MQWFYVRSMRCRIIACNRQQRWPYNLLIEKLQELEEKPNFSVILRQPVAHLIKLHVLGKITPSLSHSVFPQNGGYRVGLLSRD